MATSVNAVDYVECSATALPGVHRLFAVVMDATQRRPGSPWQPASHEGRQPKEPRGVLSRMFGTFRRSKQHANPRLSHRRRRPAAAAAATPPLVAASQGVDSGRELLAVSKYCANFKVDVDPPGPGTPQPAPPAPPTPPPTPIMARAAAISLMLQGRVSGHARRHTPQRSPAALRPPPLPTVAAPSLSPSARPPPLPTLAAPLLNLPPGVAAASGTADGHGHAGGNCAGTEAAVLRGDDVGGVAGACAVPSPLVPPAPGGSSECAVDCQLQRRRQRRRSRRRRLRRAAGVAATTAAPEAPAPVIDTAGRRRSSQCHRRPGWHRHGTAPAQRNPAVPVRWHPGVTVPKAPPTQWPARERLDPEAGAVHAPGLPRGCVAAASPIVGAEPADAARLARNVVWSDSGSQRSLRERVRIDRRCRCHRRQQQQQQQQ